MAFVYGDARREGDPRALPDMEAFWSDRPVAGWYWWPCLPGCLPDGDAVGPFDTMQAAIADAREVLR